jgi:hypothetical protein
MWFSRFGVRALSIPDFDSCWIVDQSAPPQLVVPFTWPTRFWFLVSAHSTANDMHRRETPDEIGPGLCNRYRLEKSPSMEKRILRLEDDFWRIRTDTGELTNAERNALRAYLDEKGCLAPALPPRPGSSALSAQTLIQREQTGPDRISSRRHAQFARPSR